MVDISVVTVTYNHAPYIKECIESILLQKTDYNFELIISDDSSTDGTTDICDSFASKYPDKINFLRSEENVGPLNNLEKAINQSNAKYICLCEGDDFWLDVSKIQKQVDFLENNLDYGLVHSDINILDQKTNQTIFAYNKVNDISIPNGRIYDFLMHSSHPIKTMSVCLRREIMDEYYFSNRKIMDSNWKLYDLSLWLIYSLHSKIYYFDETLATYRLLPNSMSRSSNSLKQFKFHNNIFGIFFFFMREYPTSMSAKRSVISSFLRTFFLYSLEFSDSRIFHSRFNKLCSYSKAISLYYHAINQLSKSPILFKLMVTLRRSVIKIRSK